jgi:hypothetical protein
LEDGKTLFPSAGSGLYFISPVSTEPLTNVSMTINLSLNAKVRNSIAEVVSILGIIDAALPQLAATTHVPAWAGVVIAMLAAVGNQLIKDSNVPPSVVALLASSPSTVNLVKPPVVVAPAKPVSTITLPKL